MYTIIQNMIGYVSGTGYSDTSTILAVAGALILLLVVVFIDFIKELIGLFIR